MNRAELAAIDGMELVMETDRVELWEHTPSARCWIRDVASGAVHRYRGGLDGLDEVGILLGLVSAREGKLVRTDVDDAEISAQRARLARMGVQPMPVETIQIGPFVAPKSFSKAQLEAVRAERREARAGGE